MMYVDSLLAVVKCNGRPLRERNVSRGDATVFLPFQSEYSILLKNLSHKRAVVRVTIDGTDVLNGRELVVDPNSEMELERFLDSLDAGNRFKFIQKTMDIIENRGDKVDDGFIRVEWQFERELNTRMPQVRREKFKSKPDREILTRGIYRGTSGGSQGPMGCVGSKGPSGCSGTGATINIYNSTAGAPFASMSGGIDNLAVGSSNANVNSVSYLSSSSFCFSDTTESLVNNTPLVEEGITVKGSVSAQQFSETIVGVLEDQHHTIIIRLKGIVEQQVITEAVTVKSKLKCSTCGTLSKSDCSFCPKCGTALNVRIGG